MSPDDAADPRRTDPDVEATAGAPSLPTQAGLAQQPLPIEALPTELREHPRYRILRLVGHGGMGAVYEAEHLVMGRRVALKVIHPRFMANPAAVDRFRREVRLAARLSHPNIVTAHDAEQAGETHFLVMEYVEGKTLSQHLARMGPLPVAEACSYARQAALGLQHAFERGLTHRDVKPDNLMLTPDGTVKLLDFGLARFAQEGDLASKDNPLVEYAGRITPAGTVMGTPDYLAPEQATDAQAADARSDLYSLGCTLYRMLTGRVPFPTSDPTQKLLAHAQQEPAPMATLRADLPRGLAEVVAKLMAKRPEDRYQTPAEAVAALGPFASPPPRRWLAAIPLSRKQWLALVALGLAISAAIAVVPKWSRQPPKPAPVVPDATPDEPPVIPKVTPRSPFSEAPSAYVLRHQLRDWHQLPDAKKPHARYLSLAHLAAPESAERLHVIRKELADLLNHFRSTKDEFHLVPIDPAGLVFRIDLEALGWDRRPFVERDAFNDNAKVRRQEKKSDVNLYDLLLLEYPYGSLNFSSQFKEVKKYLENAKIVRPVPYLRADWLVAQLATRELGKELALLLEVRGMRPEAPAGKKFYEDRVTAQDARAEVGWTGDEDQLDRVLEEEKGLKGLTEGKGVSRTEWELAYPGVIRRLGVEKPIRPLDGLDAAASLLQRPTSTALKIRTVNPNNGVPKQEFVAGEILGVEVLGSTEMTFEMLWKGPVAYYCVFELAQWKLQWTRAPYQYGPIALNLDLGKEQLLMVAFPKEVVANVADFPRGMLLSAHREGVRDRFVHPFYRLGANGKGFERPDVEEIHTARIDLTIVAKK